MVIGLLGEPGGGKGAVVDLLRDIMGPDNVRRCSSSEVLRAALLLWNLPSTRENFQKLAPAMEKVFGTGALSHAMRKLLEEADVPIVIFDGVRWETDVELIRSFPKNCLLYVTTSPKIRFERMKLRGEKEGEDTMSFEQFLREEAAGTEAHIPRIGVKADHTIRNDGTREELEAQTHEFYKKFLESAF